MQIDRGTPHQPPQTTTEELLEKLREVKKNVVKTSTDMLDIHHEIVKKGQKERKAYYQKKDLVEKTATRKDQQKELFDENMEIRRQREKFFAERHLERESERRKLTGKKS
ncbi:MAG: hypothetical protein CSA35_00860 [Dethiosulfovibrio peptidovorans]|nr:MAG: hypothetical protein CSA35_00860 [Dethiosulfovibrio peptidovorans]